jgi:4-hydroxybenzoate polyprenyltransferase/geranylgeranylglycerol-phosphate geranylgeranyltransferase
LDDSIKKTYTIKEKIFSHFEIWRLYTVIWCGLVSLLGSCIAYGNFPPLKIAILVTVIPIMGWISGLYLIDFIDRKLDIIQKPHRPIPSGRIGRFEAFFAGSLFAIIGFLLTLFLNLINIILIFIVAILVYSYAKFTKSRGLLGNLNRGMITFAAFFFGVLSIDLDIQTLPVYLWIFSIIFLLHDTNSNMIGAIRDLNGDKKGGYKTIPVIYGVKNTGYLSLFLSVLLYILVLFISTRYDLFESIFYIIFSLDIVLVIFFYVYLFKTISFYSRKKALNYHKFFVVERIILASAFIFGIVDIIISILILIVSLFITIVSQFYLRDRYEFQEIL